MNQQLIEKWREIFFYTVQVANFNPWERFSETDVFALVPKGTREEHFFSFLSDPCGKCGIAIYRDANAYFQARSRLHSPNPKKEPVFWLQNATVFLLGDREDVSKENYALLKALEFKCRGRGNWPYFEDYRIGYAPRPVDEGTLDVLLDDMGNLFMMMRAIYETTRDHPVSDQTAWIRTYSPQDEMYYTFPADLPASKQSPYTMITMHDNEWLKQLRRAPAKGTISLDWAYLPTVLNDGSQRVVPRLMMAVDPASGIILKHALLSPVDNAFDLLFAFISDLVGLRGKPSIIEICDHELEGYLSDLCQKAGIKLTVRKRLPQLSQARNALIKDLL